MFFSLKACKFGSWFGCWMIIYIALTGQLREGFVLNPSLSKVNNLNGAATSSVSESADKCSTTKTSFPTLDALSTNARWDLSHFMTPLHYRPYLDYVLLSHGVIADRIEKLVEDVADFYGDEEIVFVCVLKGASIFFHEFLQAYLQLQTRRKSKISFDFIRVKSYSGMQSTGKVQIIGAEHHSDAWKNKHVVFVEDIVDTGLTMSRLADYMSQEVHPLSMKVVTLLQKQIAHSQYQADFVGFSIPDVFVVGYGLDYNESFRDLRHLCVLNAAGIAAFAEQQTPPADHK